MALIVDDLNTLLWMQTQDGRKGRRRPKSIFKLLNGEADRSEIRTFRTPEEFEAARRRKQLEG